MAEKWECRVCLYLHEGEELPEECPVCGAPKSEFFPDDYEPKDDKPKDDK